MRKFLFPAIVLLFVGLLGYHFYSAHLEQVYTESLLVPIEAEDNVRYRFIVEKGMSTRAIAAKLERLKLVPHAWVVEWYVSRNGLDGQLQAGEYILLSQWSTPRIVEELLSGKSSEVAVTIPEGYRLTQIDSLFAEKGLTQPGQILAQKNQHFALELTKDLPKGVDLEGYLFPDTYYFSTENSTPAGIVQRLVSTMDSRLTSDMRAEIAHRGRTIHEVLTMASLIERESYATDERPIIAGILWKRLDEGMLLGVDATIQYAVSDGWKTPLTSDDLASNSPYNTRKFIGLPPGPICSPSLSAISAAVYPESSDYYYYLHDAQGQVHYARTNAEHNANRAAYL